MHNVASLVSWTEHVALKGTKNTSIKCSRDKESKDKGIKWLMDQIDKTVKVDTHARE